MTDGILLLDIPTKEPRECSSMHVWKVRSLLNYKGLPYTTEWLEYPDIQPRLEPLVPPEENAYTRYWCPVLRLDGKYIMESSRIALALEERHPTPNAAVSSPMTERVQGLVDAISYKMSPGYLYRLADCLSPESREWYHEQRGKLFRVKDLFEVAKLPPYEGETKWESAKGAFADLAALLKEHDGPFVMGDTVTYADFIIGGYWEQLLLLDRGGDVRDRIMKMDEVFVRHEEAVRPWRERRNY